MTGDFHRNDRLNKQIARMLAEIIMRETSDPRLQKMNITRVEVTADLAHAKVYYTLIEPEPALQQALAKAAGFFRSQIAQRLSVRTVPQLRFVIDDRLVKARRIEDLIKSDKRNQEEQD
jgi:ribosome-binding factor A